MTIAFDVDDTLIIPSIVSGFNYDVPNYDTIDLFRLFQKQGCNMVIWSGGGVEYAKMWANKLGLSANIWIKEKNSMVDIAFDDCIVDLGNTNVRVKRINNNISRELWNKTKKI
jgi:hypothetical protein